MRTNGTQERKTKKVRLYERENLRDKKVKTKGRRLLLKPTWHHRGSAFGGRKQFSKSALSFCLSLEEKFQTVRKGRRFGSQRGHSFGACIQGQMSKKFANAKALEKSQ